MDTLEQIFEPGIHGGDPISPFVKKRLGRLRPNGLWIPDLNSVKLLILTEKIQDVAMTLKKSLERFTILRVILAQGPC